MEIKRLRAKDFGCFEDFELNLSKQGLVWVGGDNRDTKSALNNGSGKSTLVRSLCYGLYGDTIEGEKTDKIIRNGQRSVSVEVELRDKKDVWLIQRSRTLSTGNNKLILTMPNGQECKESNQSIQNRIEELIGMDFFAFRNTVIYGQNDVSRFADPRTTDQQRKSMLFKILRTEILQDCHEIIKRRKKKVEEEIDQSGREIREIDIRIEEKDVKRIQTYSDGFEKQRALQMEEHRSLIKNYKRSAKKEMVLADQPVVIDIDVEKILERKKELEFLLKSCDRSERELEVKQKERDEISVDIEEMTEALIIIKESKKNIRYRLDKLGSDSCPLCESNLSKGTPKKVIQKLDKEYDELHEQQKIQQTTLDKMKEEKKSIQLEIKDLTKKTLFRKSYLDEVDKLREEIALQEKKADHAEQKREYHINRARDFLEMAKIQRESLIKVKELYNPHLKRIDEIKEEIAELFLDKKEIEKFVDEKSNELAHYRFWVHGFSNQGMPSFFLDSVMPFITSRANKYLQTLSDGDITMNFTTQKELKKSKEIRDKINIQWVIEGLPNSYPPSGGQMKKMSIATDLALMDLVSAREGDNINLLVLDEVLDGLDDEGCSRVVSLLTKLRKSKDTILVISHEPSMLDSFEKSIHVVKENGVSKLAG